MMDLYFGVAQINSRKKIDENAFGEVDQLDLSEVAFLPLLNEVAGGGKRRGASPN
jgi:hypothetical protein